MNVILWEISVTAASVCLAFIAIFDFFKNLNQASIQLFLVDKGTILLSIVVLILL